MVGRKRKAPVFHGFEAEETELVIAEKEKPLLKKELESLVKELKKKLEDEEKRKIELENEVKDLKIKLEERTSEVEVLKAEVNSRKQEKEKSEMKKTNRETKGARKSFEIMDNNNMDNNEEFNLPTHEMSEDSSSDKSDVFPVSGNRSESVSKSTNKCPSTSKGRTVEDSRDSTTEQEDEENFFHPDPEELTIIKTRVKKEVDRIKLIREKQIARGHTKEIEQEYTITKFVNDLMTASFQPEYLMTTKLSNKVPREAIQPTGSQ